MIYNRTVGVGFAWERGKGTERDIKQEREAIWGGREKERAERGSEGRETYTEPKTLQEENVYDIPHKVESKRKYERERVRLRTRGRKGGRKRKREKKAKRNRERGRQR